MPRKKKKERSLEEQKKYNKLYLIETIVVILLSVIMVFLIMNRTFFKEEYETDYFKIKIPLLYYFVKDKDDVIEFKTLRKSEYNKLYFDKYLEDLDRYSCNGEIFYYDNRFNLAIYKVDVEKSLIMKTIKIYYKVEDKDVLCK